jgi:RNA-directed DNA polymerase
MGLFDLLKSLVGRSGEQNLSRTPDVHDINDLAKRLGITVEELQAVRPAYRSFTIPKRSGGTRNILAPDDRLKAIQRRILRRLLGRLRCHPAARGFTRGQSIVSNAKAHVGKAVVVRMDLKQFFESTKAERVSRYFRVLGWNGGACDLLVPLVTHQGGLPQGAPTSPRLSNLVNYRLDTRLAKLAKKHHAEYTRYADDLTFSFATDTPQAIHSVIRTTKRIVADEGYVLHQRKKLHIRRRHNCQLVTGLVVNQHVQLPRKTRRWLRAVEHHLAKGREVTLTPKQLAGWQALQSMIDKQAPR